MLLFLLTCSSCSSLYRFYIDVQEPASVTLPVSAQNVLILNNTVTQSEIFGIEKTLTYNGQSVTSDFPLSLDYTAWSAIDGIAGALDESDFFNTIAVYREPIRSDSRWLPITYLSPEQQYDFYDTENFDALLVVEQLFFTLKEDVRKVRSGPTDARQNAFVVLHANGIITCSMYTYGNEKPLTTFQVSDSINVNSVFYADSTILFVVTPERVLKELSYILGNKAAKRFVPTWKTVERTIFIKYNSRMQEATGYAANDRWADAELIWNAEYGTTTKPLNKAKIAINLAVANEMQDKLEQASEWVQKSKEYLEKVKTNKNDKEIELINKYIAEFEQRVQNNRLLDLQWGKE